MPRNKLKKIIGDTKRFTAYEFVEMVWKMACVKYSEPHARRLLRSLGFAVKKTLRMSDRVPPREEIETHENGGFTVAMADEIHQNSNIFGTGAVCVRGTAEPVPMPLGNRRQTVYGGITLDGKTCYMTVGRANDRSFIKYLNKMQRRFGKVAVVVDNAAYHDSGRVRRYLEKSDDFIKLIFLPAHAPFLNPAEWLWRNGKAEIRRAFRGPAKSYSRRKIMSVYESLETTFDPRNTPFRNLDKTLLA